MRQLYQALKKSQEAKGIYFNKDKDLIQTAGNRYVNRTPLRLHGLPLPAGLLRPGKDKDIICPCVHREPDLEEFGACYCRLYVSKAVHNNQALVEYVPERRPPEKIF